VKCPEKFFHAKYAKKEQSDRKREKPSTIADRLSIKQKNYSEGRVSQKEILLQVLLLSTIIAAQNKYNVQPGAKINQIVLEYQ